MLSRGENMRAVRALRLSAWYMLWVFRFGVLFGLALYCVFVGGISVGAVDGFSVYDGEREWGTETRTDLFHTDRYDNNLLYPGVSGVYNFKVRNSGEKYETYKVSIEDENVYGIPLGIRIKRNGIFEVGTDDEWALSADYVSGVYELKGEDSYSIEWKWDYLVSEEQNIMDTSFGVRAVTEVQPYYLNIKVYAEGGTDMDSSEPSDTHSSEPSVESSVPEQSVPKDTVNTGDRSGMVTSDCMWLLIVSGVVAVVSMLGGSDVERKKNV